jgi:predicted O-methyltransferase YrrM
MNLRNKFGQTLSLRDGLIAGGAPTMWARVMLDALPYMKQYAPAGSDVLEVGYGNGLLSIWLGWELGIRMTGLDISRTCQIIARNHSKMFCVDDIVQFECCLPEETCKYRGQYDAVFIKTVLYSSKTLEEYGQWLDWIVSVLRPGGVLINFESGRANSMVQMYRRFRRRSYTDLCLYKSEIEALYNDRFEVLYRRYYGGWSQFFAPIKPLYRLAYCTEEAIRARDSDNCFIVAFIGKKVNIDPILH